MSIIDSPILPHTGYRGETYVKVLWDYASLFPDAFAKTFKSRDKSYELADKFGLVSGTPKELYDRYLYEDKEYQNKLRLLRRWVVRSLRVNTLVDYTPCQAGEVSSIMQDLLWLAIYIGVPRQGDFILSKVDSSLGVCPENIVWKNQDGEVWIQSDKVDTLSMGYKFISENSNYPITVNVKGR